MHPRAITVRNNVGINCTIMVRAGSDSWKTPDYAITMRNGGRAYGTITVRNGGEENYCTITGALLLELDARRFPRNVINCSR